MKRGNIAVILLALLIINNIVFIQTASATNVTFSQAFTQGQTANSVIVSAWESFRSQLSGSYNSFTWSSTNGASITVSDPIKIQTLANALRAGSATNVVIGSNTWFVGLNCGATAGYSVIVEFSNAGSCTSGSTYALRPLIGNYNWGGSKWNNSQCPLANNYINLL